MNINISSTSYLLPKSESWKNLKKENEVTFSDYGRIFSENKSSNIEIKIIFLNDIVDEVVTKKNFKKQKTKLNKIFTNFISTKNINKKYIICLSAHYYFNPINEAQKENFLEKIIEDLKKKLYNLILKKNNFFLLDLDRVFAFHGFDKCFDQRNFVFSRCRLSSFGLEKLIENFNLLINRIKKPSKKVLILDCDNTLWGGVLGEDGLQNLSIGQDGIGKAYQEFQKAIIEVKNRGILLVLSSKNKKEEVIKVLREHSSMLIKEKHITSFQINWNEKYKNILKLSNDLSLNLNSFVFWDDNPIERKKIRLKIKEIEVVEPHNDISEWAKQLLELPSLSKLVITNEDLKKSNQYKFREKFLTEKNSAKNEIDYLKSIKIKPSFLKLNVSNISRAEQMCMKTNQFNLNSKRLTSNELKYLNKKRKIFLVDLKDVYGDQGIISLFILNETKKVIIIELFLISCRILGRYLENWILEKIRLLAKKKNKDYIIAEYTKSNQNEVAINFLKQNRFSKLTKKQKKECFQNMKINKKMKYVLIKCSDKIQNVEIYEKNKQSIN